MGLGIVIFIALLLPAVIAVDEGADWFGVPIHYSWDLSMAGACSDNSQCLIHLLGNQSYDGDLDRYFRLTDPRMGPRCANNGQQVLDYVCESGNWTTRTKYLALQMLKVAEDTSESYFTLFCDNYENVLNRVSYAVQGRSVDEYLGSNCAVSSRIVPCVNSICVLKTENLVAVGTTINVPINDSGHSFLRALNKSTTLCDSVNTASNNFVLCNENIWYNPVLGGVISIASGPLPAPTNNTKTKIRNPMLSMSSYVLDVLHNSSNPGMNFVYFPKTRLFNHLYVAQNGPRAVFGFLEAGLKPEYALLPDENTEPVPLDYIGVRYVGIELDANPELSCLNIIKRYDTNAFCENQTSNGFNVIARHRCEPGYEDVCQGASPIVGVWPALTGKIRP